MLERKSERIDRIPAKVNRMNSKDRTLKRSDHGLVLWEPYRRTRCIVWVVVRLYKGYQA